MRIYMYIYILKCDTEIKYFDYYYSDFIYVICVETFGKGF